MPRHFPVDFPVRQVGSLLFYGIKPRYLLNMIDANLTDILSDFSPITLGEMNSVSLMKRSDTKFVFPLRSLPAILRAMSGGYRVLQIDKKSVFHYANMYFDTADQRLYQQHHNGRLNRYKIRSRRYIESGQSFFEVKLKLNGKRTHKERIPYNGNLSVLSREAEALVCRMTDMNPDLLQPSLGVHYARMTFVCAEQRERVTIDTALRFETGTRQEQLDSLVIAEVKQERRSRASAFVQLMQECHFPPLSISKYCIGVALTHTNIKHNRFKPKLRTLRKVCYGIS